MTHHDPATPHITRLDLDFPLTDPAVDAGEAEMLQFALDRSRTLIAWKCGGLDAAALHRPHLPSAMTLGKILKHLAVVEARYTIDFDGDRPGAPLDTPEAQSDPTWAWRTAPDDTPEHLQTLWTDAVRRSRTALRTALANGGLDQPAKYTATDDGASPNLRRIVVDLIDEYARHLGHVDLFREATDGLVGENPPSPLSPPA
ncbi:DUF664 domain-containing protein [Catenulispora subtropica]